MGVPRREYLYELQFWELILISRGYERRHYTMWSAIRWHAYNVMSAIPYTDLRKAGINSAMDLLPLPTDKPDEVAITDEERDSMQQEMDMLNALWSSDETSINK